jgi:thiol:disulfide interchange protein DsbA
MQAFCSGSRFISRGVAGLALSVSLAMAAAPAATSRVALVEDYNYHTLPHPEPVSTGNKIEVLEFFSYGCVHCNEYEPSVRAWQSRQPKDVQLVLIPATFNGNFALYARGFYAAQSLGVADKLHEKMFAAVWGVQGHAANNIEQLADLYAGLGVDRAKFLEAARSMGVAAKISSTTEKSERMLLQGTPTFYVDGKYQLLTIAAGSFDDVFARLDALVARARAERAAAAKAKH